MEHLKDLSVGGIILKCICKIRIGAWTGFVSHGIRTSGGIL